MQALSSVISIVIALLEGYHHLDVVVLGGGLCSSDLDHMGVAYQVRVLHPFRLSTHHSVVTAHSTFTSISLLLVLAFISLRAILHVLLL